MGRQAQWPVAAADEARALPRQARIRTWRRAGAPWSRRLATVVGDGERVLLFGPPGVGKGTQALRLGTTLRIPHISTGEILRAAIRSNTGLGLRVRDSLAEGMLVPDESMLEVVRRRLAERDAQNGYILDGFPRTVSQAEDLARLLGGAPPFVDAVIVLEAPPEDLVRRLAGRRICENCQDSYHITGRPPRVTNACDRCGASLIERADDREETVRFRQTEYAAKTAPVIAYFESHGWPVRMVDALGDIDQIFGRIYAAMFWHP